MLLPGYDRGWLALDAIAGLTPWGLVVPEAMAHAEVAGVPPQVVPYILTVSSALCALLGTLRHQAVGATSASADTLSDTLRHPITPAEAR